MLGVQYGVTLKPEDFKVKIIHPGWVQTDMGGEGADLTVQESVEGMYVLECSIRAGIRADIAVWEFFPLPRRTTRLHCSATMDPSCHSSCVAPFSHVLNERCMNISRIRKKRALQSKSQA